MKALTVNQPWAVLLAADATRYSVRSWHTRYRGPLALHAGRTFTPEAIDVCLHEEVKPLLARAGYEYIVQLPLQALVGVADLVACIRAGDQGQLDPTDPVVRRESVSPESWVWVFAKARPPARPVPCRGRPGLFSVPDDLIGRVRPA